MPGRSCTPDPARPAAAAGRAAASTTLRLATWNLCHGRGTRRGDAGLGAVAARIALLGADVVAVQEVDRCQSRSGRVDQLGELADRLGWHGLFAATMVGPPAAMRPAAPGPTDDGVPAYGVGLLSRYPVAATATDVLPAAGRRGRRADGEARVALRAVVSAPAGPVGVCATHLSWLPRTAARQLRSVLDLAADGPGPAVVVGDLNLPCAWVRAALRGTGWRAACAGATFPASRPLVQLDHILVRGGRLVGATAGPAGPSDHRVVSAAVLCEWTGARDDARLRTVTHP